MKFFSLLRSITTAILDHARTEGELDEELRSHVESRAQDLDHLRNVRAAV